MHKLTPEDRRRIILEGFFILSIIFVATLIAFAWLLNDVQDVSRQTRRIAEVNRTLIRQAVKRDARIQASRLESCKRTYEGVRKVFKPFFPPSKSQTEKQKADLKKFNDTVNTLKKQCVIQTKPKLSKKKKST